MKLVLVIKLKKYKVLYFSVLDARWSTAIDFMLWPILACRSVPIYSLGVSMGNPGAALDGMEETKVYSPFLNSNLGRPDRNQSKYINIFSHAFRPGNFQYFFPLHVLIIYFWIRKFR
jgi:hypothetical protein